MTTKEKRILGVILVLVTVIWVLTGPSPMFAMEISEIMVTDVTPTSFSVAWLAGEAASGNIELYNDSKGIYPVVSCTVIEIPCTDSDIFTQAAQKGILKIKVEDLSPDTTYYFRVSSTSNSDPGITLIHPPDNSLLQVTTEQEARLSKNDAGVEMRLSSHILIAGFYHDDKITPADHSLVVAKIDGASYPISAYVGEGAASPLCAIDLNNLFDQTQHSTLEAAGGSQIILYHYKGTDQTAIRRFYLPQELPDDEPIYPAGISQEVSLSQGLNYFSFQVDPQNSPEIHAVLSGKYTELWTYQNGAWIDLTNNDTHIFLPNQGYLITTTEPVTVTVVGGWRMDEIPLSGGLNIVGYRSEVPVPVEDAMAPLVGKYTSIWGYGEGEWLSYDPTLPETLNTLTEIVPGRSYYIFIKEAAATGVSW